MQHTGSQEMNDIQDCLTGESNMENTDWPISNYPIFFALVLLSATAVVLAMGDETLAESLAIHAYYLLVIGVAIRFFELALSDKTKENLKSVVMKLLRHTGGFAQQVYRSQYKVSENILKSDLIKEHKDNSSRPWFNVRLIFIRCLSTLMKVSKEVSVYLSVLFVLLCIYGLAFGWLVVSGYLKSLILIIIGFLSIYVVLYTINLQCGKT
jgi:hypothetical protein